MVSRFVTAVAIAAVLAAARPAIADGPLAPVPPASANPTSPAGRSTARHVGIGLLIAGGVLGLVSAFFIVRAHQSENSSNYDDPSAYAAYGLLFGVPAVASLTVGAAFLIPSDAGPGSNIQNAHPRFVQLPRGLTLRFTF